MNFSELPIGFGARSVGPSGCECGNGLLAGGRNAAWVSR